MPDLKDNNPILSNGVYDFRVNQTERYYITVGAKIRSSTDSAGDVGGTSFGGATVTLQQDNLSTTGFDGITAPASAEAVLSEGTLKVVVTGVTGISSIGVRIQNIDNSGR